MVKDWWGVGPSTLAQWVSGIGTLLAVIIALFKDPIVAWRRRPRLDVTCSKEVPWTVKTQSTYWQGKWAGGGVWRGDCYFVRAKVENIGNIRSEKVQVSATRLSKRGADDKFVDMAVRLPLNMKWANSKPDQAVMVLDGISSGMSAFCDIVSVCDPDNPYQSRPAKDVTVAQPQTEVRIVDLAPGTYRLTIRIAAANVAPIDRIVEFTHTGTWIGDDVAMRLDCLGVSLV
jgi:hypothetical protein